MKEIPFKSFPIKCFNCNKQFEMRLQDFEKGKAISCPHCKTKFVIKDDYYKQIQDSIRKLQKTISDVQKKLDKSFK